MHNRQSHDHEQRLAVDDTAKNKFLLSSPTPVQDNSTSRLSPNWLPTRFHPTNSQREIKRRNALSVIPLHECDELLDIRSIRKYSQAAHDENKQASTITINISGDRFQTYVSTLQLYPNTLLGDEKKRKNYWNPRTQEYFFDRHRACFEAILYYYQSHGRLRRPDFVPIDTFLEEISFFELGQEASHQVRQTENIKEVEQIPMPRTIWRRYIWFYLELPQHSVLARLISLISMLFTILSCVSLAIESLPNYTDHWNDICKERANVSLNSTYVPRCSALFLSPFFIIQTVCVTYFTIEFFLRFISTPSYYRFVLAFLNWVDLGAIIPYYVFLGIQLADQDIGLNTNAILCIRLLRILRFSRILKIHLVFKRLKSLRVLSATIKESLIDFAVMITILTLLAFLFGTATYFAEQEANGDVFDSIPKSIYWGIITMTGVGYGDMVPITAIGRTVTCLCALCGAATMGMLVSVLVDRYQRVYNRKMYISETEMATVDLDITNNPADNTKSDSTLHKSSRRQELSAAISRSISSLEGKIKHDQSQSSLIQAYKLQFVVSFNNSKDNSATDRVVSIMKTKLTEAISTTNMDVELKLIDNNNKEVWRTSSFDSSTVFTPNIILVTDTDHPESSKMQFF